MSRTTEYLLEKGVPFQVIPHQATETSLDEAKALRIDPDTVAKTVLLDTKWGRVLAVVPADRKLDMKLAVDVVGDHHVHLASEDEIAREFPQFQLGCLPPLGGLLGMETFVDGSVMRHDEVVFAADRTDSVKARTLDVFEGEHVTVTRLSTPAAAPSGCQASRN